MKQALMLCTIVVALLCSKALVCQSTPVLPTHPATADQIRQLMAITHSVERMREGMQKMVAQQQASMPMLPPAFWTDFEAEMNKIDWIAVATPVYRKYLSEDDVSKAIAFYSTEAGQRALDSSIAVSLEMFQKGSEMGKQIGTQLGQKYSAQIQENMQKTQAAPAPQPK